MTLDPIEHERLIQKKKALTKWLLVALFFNIALQFESVEKLFNTSYLQSNEVLTAAELCGSGYNIELPKPAGEIIELAGLVGYLNPTVHTQGLGVINKKTNLEFYTKTFSLNVADVTLTPSFIVFSFSGLSPPKA